MSAFVSPRVSSLAAFYSPATAHPDLICGDDSSDGAVASFPALQVDRWRSLARRLQSSPRTRYGRGYRIAVSRIGIWSKRARALG